MPQNMAVSVTLRLQDLFTGPMRNILGQMQQLQRAAQDFNRAFGGTGSNNGFGRMQSQVRAVASEVRNLTDQFTRLGRAAGSTGTSGGVVQTQIAQMRQLLTLQRQAIQNSNQLASSGGGRGNTPRGATGFWGRPGFNPNASITDRFQYRAVNTAEQSLLQGFLDLDRARTNLMMLANPRRSSDNPDELLPGVISPEIVKQIEQEAVGLTQQFRALNRAHVLDTFKELVTQFQSPDSAFALLPQLLSVQEWQILQGDTVEQAREGMARLVRAMGLSGRLVDNNGNLNAGESQAFLANYLRARMIGGVDVTPDQVFQVMKYLKTSGQTMSQEALLTAFIGMPDIRGSTFGNQLNMLVRQLTGGATQAAQQAMAAAGLGSIPERTASGPHMFNPVDEVMLRDNPFEWFNKHIVGPQGYLRRIGIDPMTANAAQISAALRPVFSNQSAENIANAIVNQQSEWKTQVQNALRFNLTAEARMGLGGQSGWYQMMAARSKLQDVMGSITENFKSMLPLLTKITEQLGKLARYIDPKIGNPLAGLGVMGAGLLGAFWASRGLLLGMNPMARTALGVGGGWLLGGVGGAITGGLMLRGMGGNAAAMNAAAGAAGAAAGQSWARRFGMGALRWLRSTLVVGVVAYLAEQIIENWTIVSTRVQAIWDDMKKAAPVWAGGEGQGWGSIGQGFAGIHRDVQGILGLGPEHYLPRTTGLPIDDEFRQPDQPWWAWLRAPRFPWESAPAAGSARQVGNTVTTGPINVTVNVTQSNADPKAIGEAAGNAVGSGLRGVLGDTAWPLP